MDYLNTGYSLKCVLPRLSQYSLVFERWNMFNNKPWLRRCLRLLIFSTYVSGFRCIYLLKIKLIYKIIQGIYGCKKVILYAKRHFEISSFLSDYLNLLIFKENKQISISILDNTILLLLIFKQTSSTNKQSQTPL